MKFNFFYICLLLGILLSCKREHLKTDDSPNFGFTANNINYKWNFVNSPASDDTDVFFRKTTSQNTNDSMYLLIGRNQSANVEMVCAIPTSKLKPGTYTTVTKQSDMYVENLCFLKDITYGTKTDDYMVVTISSIVDNYASGSFSTVMHDLRSGVNELRIVNGYFNHVLISE